MSVLSVLKYTKPFFRPGINFSAECQLRTLSSIEIPISDRSGETKVVSTYKTELTAARGALT